MSTWSRFVVFAAVAAWLVGCSGASNGDSGSSGTGSSAGSTASTGTSSSTGGSTARSSGSTTTSGSGSGSTSTSGSGSGGSSGCSDDPACQGAAGQTCSDGTHYVTCAVVDGCLQATGPTACPDPEVCTGAAGSATCACPADSGSEAAGSGCSSVGTVDCDTDPAYKCETVGSCPVWVEIVCA